MDLKKLDTFRSIARYGSLGRAATRQGLTLPALSIQLKKLEAELGAKLFDHRPNKLVLTDRGRIFLKEVNRVFEALDRAKASVEEPADEFVGNVSVSLATDIAKFFAPGIARFVQDHPKLNVAILARPSRETMSMVVNGDVDIGVGFFRKTRRGITKRKIGETDLALVFPRGHPIARIKRPSLKEIAEHRVVLRRRSSATRRFIDQAFSAQGVDLPNILEVARCQSAMDFVELGLGVGLVHTICACAEPHKKLVQVNMSRYFGHTDVAVITRSNATLGAAQRSLMQIFMDSSEAVRRAQLGAS
jgi:DNA-binding transcriptional LysR family regulator